MHRALAEVFEEMTRHDLMVGAFKKDLNRFEQGSRDYARTAGRIAETYVNLGDTKRATEFYRKAIGCNVSQTEFQYYQHGLFEATEGKEGEAKADFMSVEPVADLKAMRIRAESLLGQHRDFGNAAALYEQILEMAPTDVKSMDYLGRAYEGLGKTAEATALYEKVVFGMHKWNPSYSKYTATSTLGRLYRQNRDINGQVKLFALTGRGSYAEIRGRLETQNEFEEFHNSLLEQWQLSPDDLRIRFYLVHHFVERFEIVRASEILAKLRTELSSDQGHIKNISHAMELAQGYEKLGEFDEALAILPPVDYEESPDRNDRMYELLMRLHAAVGRPKKALH